MTIPNDPVFPDIEIRNNMGAMGVGQMPIAYHGLTKREFFAAMAMEGFLAEDREQQVATRRVAEEAGLGVNIAIARMAVAMADALISELNR